MTERVAESAAAALHAAAAAHAQGAQALYLRLRHDGRHRRRAWLLGDAIDAQLPAWVEAALLTRPRRSS